MVPPASIRLRANPAVATDVDALLPKLSHPGLQQALYWMALITQV
jgi:hypothetical protein